MSYFFFEMFILLFCVHEYFAYIMSASHVYSAPRRQHHIPLDWSYLPWLWASIWVSGIGPWISARPASALNRWIISPTFNVFLSLHFHILGDLHNFDQPKWTEHENPNYAEAGGGYDLGWCKWGISGCRNCSVRQGTPQPPVSVGCVGLVHGLRAIASSHWENVGRRWLNLIRQFLLGIQRDWFSNTPFPQSSQAQ